MGFTNRAKRLICALRRAREREVFKWASRGKTAWEISQILSIGKRTVNTHLRNFPAQARHHECRAHRR
ncbi:MULTISPECIES: helix-turn-helix transcriptional regulator [Hyphomicrobiales]|uniref:helix-turn-helix domain-containing protein n=1 Tax=Hyphomicrobiales TaxID=356 RepID=UPI0009DB2611|nr:MULTISPECIES: helix-turn-helix transcriptional regulator [Phyllobacteriaceae]